MSNNALKALMSFATPYICEAGFSAFAEMKSECQVYLAL